MIKLYKDPFNDLMDSFFEFPLNKTVSKSVKLNEDDNQYNILISVPGLTKEDLTLSINDNVIKISHEKNETIGENFSFTKSFMKQYLIPDDVDEKSIDGKVENGVLSITLPKFKKKKFEKTILLN